MSNLIISKGLEQAKGKMPYTLRNDYMFRCLFQTNQKALKGLLCALLHLPSQDIKDIEITNPIIVGESCEDKEIRMDIVVILNNNEHIDLEMQASHFTNWTVRSICYLSRMYDSLIHGEDYSDVRPSIHIGILDHTLFPQNPCFHSQNLLMDKHTQQIYSDKFALNVLDLTQIDLATDEDKQWKIDYWAKIFKANTWEELKMLTANQEDFKTVTESLYRLNADENVRKRCRDREDYYNMINSHERRHEQAEKRIAQLQAELAKRRGKKQQ